jgi:TetR/AcrR family transcriptional regulator, transcriptional repressor for nem operon
VAAVPDQVPLSRSEQKAMTRRRILDAAGEKFRSAGYDGVGVDGLAKAAGVTSGAFYVHFDSKSDAFGAALAAALDEVNDGIAYLQKTSPKTWWSKFVVFYTGERRRADLAHSCGLQSLAPEVARASADDVEQFEAGLLAIAKTIVSGPVSPRAPRTIEDALVALSVLIGAVTLARGVHDPQLADLIADGACRQLTKPISSKRVP